MKRAKAEPAKAAKRDKSGRLAWALYALLALLIVAYAVLGSGIVGLAALVVIVLIFYYEIRHSVKTEGTRKSVIDIAGAICAAVAVWVILIIVLHTTAPVDAVSSCSMLPVLHRGDLVVLSGITNITGFAASKHVPVVGVSASAFAGMEANMSREFLSYYAYFNGNKSAISYIFGNNLNYSIGLYGTQCLSTYAYLGRSDLFRQCYVSQASQSRNLIRYNYSVGKVSVGGAVDSIVYTSAVSIGNVSITENYSNPIIVYQTTAKDYFSGSIIHRVVAIVNASGQYYFLTKGDNNQALDIEFENYPANQSEAVGYVLADVPLLGYVKLLLSGQLAVPAGCNQTILR
jgi:hypothetical protein